MATKIPRQTHKVFGVSGPTTDFSQFGSLVAGSPLKTKDLATIMALPAWNDGLQDSIYGGNKNLLLQDLNAVLLEHSTQVAYLMQAGTAEWDAGTTYFKGSIAQRTDGSGNATGELYLSAVDNNLNQPLPIRSNNANWTYQGGNSIPAGVSVEYMGVVVPSGYEWEDGGALSRAAFSALFAALNLTMAGNLTSGSPVVTGIASTAILQIGWYAGGTGVASGAKILSIDSATQVTLTLPALSTQTPSAIDFGPWGLGDGSTTFNKPDTRRRVGVGAGGAGNSILGNVLGAVGGEDAHVMTIAEMPPHHHTGYNTPNGVTGQSGVGSHLMEPGNTGDTGGGGAHNNIQQSYVCTKIIKT